MGPFVHNCSFGWHQSNGTTKHMVMHGASEPEEQCVTASLRGRVRQDMHALVSTWFGALVCDTHLCAAGLEGRRCIAPLIAKSAQTHPIRWSQRDSHRF
eukprot:775528-Amphidinium_carterae.2